MLEELIKARKEKCIEAIKEKHPELLRNGQFSMYEIEGFHMDTAPDIALEAVAWDYLEQNNYWDGHSSVCQLIKKNKDYFSEEDQKNITKIILSQILEGKRVSSGIPSFSDAWKLFRKEPQKRRLSSSLFTGAVTEISPLEKYVAEEDRVNAVNNGFWHMMKLMPNKVNSYSPLRVLLEIMDYPDFFGAFDYKRGAEEAEKLPDDFDLHENFNDWYTYMRWYLVQEYYVWAKYNKEKAEEISSKLAAPLVEHLYLTKGDNWEDSERLKRLVHVFVDKGMIKTKPIQRVLGNVFEYHIKDGLANGHGAENYSPKLVAELEKCLIDSEKHVKKVLKELGDEIDIDKLPEKLKEYLPKETVESRVNEIRKDMEAMERIDVDVFRKWMNLKIEKDVAIAAHSKVRNKTLEMYFKQSPRPSGDVVAELNRFPVQGSGFITDKFKGCAVLDLLLRKKWDEANEILMEYMRFEKPGRQREAFGKAITAYVNLHGKIQLDKKGLETRVCYPQYNIITEFYDKNKSLFQLKE